MEVVAKAADGCEAVSLAKRLRPDVAIIDVTMPKLNGVEAAKQIKAACSDIAVLIISAFGYESYVFDSIKAGASGYLLKSSPLRELINAVRSISIGQAVFDLKAASKILYSMVTEHDGRRGVHQRLRPREVEILRLAAKGISNKEIASELIIRDSTVRTHLARIFRELGVSSRTEAVLHALKEGWITLDDLP